MRAGLIGTDTYLEEWRRVARPCGEDLDAEVEQERARLDAAYDDAASSGSSARDGKEDG